MRIFCISFLAAFFLLSFAASAVAADETAYDRVMRTKTLRCGYAESPPSFTKDPNTGKISGVGPDIMREIGKDLGLKIEWTEEVGWGNFIEGLRTGRYDAFCAQQWPDEARTMHQELTRPVLYSFLEAYVRVDDARFDGDLDAINDPKVKIPAIDGDVGMMLAKKGFPKASILTLPQTATLSDMLMSIKTGKADVIFLEPPMLKIFEKENPGVLRKVKDTNPAFVFASRYGVNSGETRLRDRLDVALQSMLDDGRLEKIIRGYSEDYILPAKGY